MFLFKTYDNDLHEWLLTKYLFLFAFGGIDEVCFNRNGMEDIKTGDSEMQEQEDKSIKVKRFFTSQRKPVPAKMLFIYLRFVDLKIFE